MFKKLLFFVLLLPSLVFAENYLSTSDPTVNSDDIVLEAYGSIYYDGGEAGDTNTVSQLTIAVEDTVYPVNAANTSVDFVCSEVSGITCDATTNFDLTVADANAAGPYLLAYQISMSATASEIATCSLYKEGVRIVESSFTRKLSAAGDVGSASGMAIDTLVDGDSIDLRCENSANANEIDIWHYSLTINRIGK